MENVFCFVLLFMPLFLCSLYVVLKTLYAEGDGDFQNHHALLGLQLLRFPVQRFGCII